MVRVNNKIIVIFVIKIFYIGENMSSGKCKLLYVGVELVILEDCCLFFEGLVEGFDVFFS